MTWEKNTARRELRAARREGRDKCVIREVARKFHTLIRIHSKTKRVQLKARFKLEAGKARRECARCFWMTVTNPLSLLSPPKRPRRSLKRRTPAHQESFMKPPQYGFNDAPITIAEISGIIKRSKSSSSPSPIDRVSYKIFKRCPALLPALIDLYNTCWESQTVPLAWKHKVIRLIPKQSATDNPAEPGHFRPNALTSCMGKVFTSILKERWLQYMIANEYLDTNTQKAFVRNIPGCTEQYQKLLGAVNEVFRRHKSISVCWVDLANAYGSVNHGLIDFTLQHYHATARFRNTVAHLYTALNVVVTTPSWVTSPIPLQIGVYQGDPLSVVIFNSVMSTLGESFKQYKQFGYSFTNSSTKI